MNILERAATLRRYPRHPTPREAAELLGHDHVRWLLADWAWRIAGRIQGSWHANQFDEHRAYCSLMQAGEAVAEYLVKEE